VIVHANIDNPAVRAGPEKAALLFERSDNRLRVGVAPANIPHRSGTVVSAADHIAIVFHLEDSSSFASI
jgi:hypothetical protein